jgi:hypothetical protein
MLERRTRLATRTACLGCGGAPQRAGGSDRDDNRRDHEEDLHGGAVDYRNAGVPDGGLWRVCQDQETVGRRNDRPSSVKAMDETAELREKAGGTGMIEVEVGRWRRRAVAWLC